MAVAVGGGVGHAAASSRDDRDERLLERDAVAGREREARDRARVRRGDRQLHLHRLQDEQDVALGDGVAVGDVDEQDGAGHRRLQRAGRRAGAAARVALGAHLKMMAVAGDPDGVVADGDGVAALDAVERDEAARRRVDGARGASGLPTTRLADARRRAVAARAPRRARRARGATGPAGRALPAAATIAAATRSSGGAAGGSARTRSSSPVSCSPARTSSRASSARENAALVVTPDDREARQRAVEAAPAPSRGRARGR